MKLGAFVVTYNRAPILVETLHKLLSQTRPPDNVLVIDNASTDDTELAVKGNFPHVTYLRLADNLGPAGAACHGLHWAVQQGCDWIYCGDDDDPPACPFVLERLLKIPEVDCADVGGVGLVGGLWDWRKGEIRRIPDDAFKGIVNVDFIAGGQQLIFRTQAVQAVGYPDGKLFWGLDDLEYCLRMKQASYRLLVDGSLALEIRAKHGRLGLKNTREMRALRRSQGTPISRARRRYYSTRNYIYMMRHTFRRPDLARREMSRALVRACGSWTQGVQGAGLFSTLQLRAILDAYGNRMGRTVAL